MIKNSKFILIIVGSIIALGCSSEQESTSSLEQNSRNNSPLPSHSNVSSLEWSLLREDLFSLSQLQQDQAKWESFFKELTLSDFAQLNEFLTGLDSKKHKEELLFLFQLWVQSNFQTSKAFILAHRDFSHRKLFLQTLMPEWSQQEPGEAFDWIVNGNSDQQGYLSESLIHLSQTDWEAARDKLIELKNNPNQVPKQTQIDIPGGFFAYDEQETVFGYTSGNLFQELLNKGQVQEARELLDFFSEENNLAKEKKASAYEDIGFYWAEHDLQQVLKWVTQESSSYRHNIKRGVVRSWVQQEPTKAASWSVLLSPGEQRSQILDTLIENWADLDEASIWLNQQPSHPDYDLAITQLVRRHLSKLNSKTSENENFSTLIGWAQSIHDDETRKIISGTIVSAWQATDPEGEYDYSEYTKFRPRK